MLNRCKDCGKSFDPRAKKHGLATQCEICGIREEEARQIQRYLGRRDGTSKHGNLEIFRTDLKTVRRYLIREIMAGKTANLPLSSPKSGPKNED